MDEFLEDLKSGEIQFRDRWQFELKSEFSPLPSALESTYVQEFYFFIPNALQINSSTYAKEQFYSDLTNMIRYKTPPFTLEELVQKNNERSPFYRLKAFAEKPDTSENAAKAEIELKLLGNIFRSSLRERVLKILNLANRGEAFEGAIDELCHAVQQVRVAFDQLADSLLPHYKKYDLHTAYRYLDEFICNSIDYLITGLLDELRKEKRPLPETADNRLCQLIREVKKQREKYDHSQTKRNTAAENREQILYRSGLLKKYIMDALMLPINRSSIQDKYGHLIASISAGIAMSVYLLLFAWQGQWFVINSLPFIFLTVGAYVLKDRLKDGIKSLSYQRAFRWFSDYTTEIRTPDESRIIGELKESFGFVDENKIPLEIKEIRHREFHSAIEEFKRPEQVIYFKRTIKIFTYDIDSKKRLRALNILLRFNIQDFLAKASSPYHSYTTLEPDTDTLQHLRLPKVYHLNIILKNSFRGGAELNKFRLIVDKNGIKHIEQVKPAH